MDDTPSARPLPHLDDPTRAPGLPAAFGEDLEALHAELGEAVARTGVACQASGACCDFRRAEHVLFATSAEVTRARAHFGALAPEVREAAPASARLCPFWQGRRCVARAARPLGCRVYFCDPGYTATHAAPLAEAFHARLKRLHEAHGVPYRYVPFVAALRGALADAAGGTTPAVAQAARLCDR